MTRRGASPDRPVRLPVSVGAVCALLAIAAITLLVAGCAGRPLEARSPSWLGLALGRRANLLASVDLRALREDPLYGPLLRKASRTERRGPLGAWLDWAEQLDFAASLGERDEVAWVAAVHGPAVDLDEDSRRASFGEARAVGSGQVYAPLKAEGPWLFTRPGAWVFASGVDPGLRSTLESQAPLERSEVPRGVLLELSASGGDFLASLQRKARHRAPAQQGVTAVSLVVYGSDRGDIVSRAVYRDEPSAELAEREAREAEQRLRRNPLLTALAQLSETELSLRRSGAELTARLHIGQPLVKMLERELERGDNPAEVSRPAARRERPGL